MKQFEIGKRLYMKSSAMTLPIDRKRGNNLNIVQVDMPLTDAPVSEICGH